MQIISQLNDFSAPWEGAVATLGDFDGLHRGHRQLIERITEIGKERSLAPILVTYDPSPKKVLQKLRFDSRLFIRDEKIMLLQQFSLRASVLLPFDLTMAGMSAKRFLIEILLQKLKIRHILLGYDHRFGLNRRGSFDYLVQAGNRYQFTTERISAVTNQSSEVISSSLIRKKLRAGLIAEANKHLITPYFVTGTVIKGRQMGRQLGVPTANLHIDPEKLLPAQGVYFCYLFLAGKYHKAVANIGFNPTFENVDLSVEVHIIDFSDNLYGDILKVYFGERIRDEQKFGSLEELKTQIEKDIQFARLADLPEGSRLR